MANDDTYLAKIEWEAIEANGSDIADGTFSVFALTDEKVFFRGSDTLPDNSETGTSVIVSTGDFVKYALSGSRKLFARAASSEVVVGIIPA